METLKATLKINYQGVVLESAHPDCFLGYLKQSDTLSDRVHINDRIVVLSFLADLRDFQKAVPISVRISGNDPTRFMPVVLHCISVHQNFILLRIEANHSDFANGGMNGVSPFACAAHEMRTPLNAILGFADLLEYMDEQQNIDDKRHDYIAMIKKAGHHLLAVVNKTLKDQEQAYSENNSGISLVAMVLNETLDLTFPLHGHRTIHIQGASIPVACQLDTLSFRQICFNLISNAIKYSRDDGHILIDIAVLKNGYCQLVIEDDGIGMDHQLIARLGMPFLRSSDAVAFKIEGVGLGLAMVFDLVKRAGGRIKFESQKGKGTKVKLLLPLAPANILSATNRACVADANNASGLSNGGYCLTSTTQFRNDGKTAQDTSKPDRKTA